MGRHAKVPLKGGRLVKASQVGTGANTPYSPSDVHWKALKRMGYDEIPSFADERAGDR